MIDKCMTLCIKNDLLFAPAFFGRIALTVCSGPGNGIAMHMGESIYHAILLLCCVLYMRVEHSLC